MKNGNSNFGFSFIWQILKRFVRSMEWSDHFIKHKPLIYEELMCNLIFKIFEREKILVIRRALDQKKMVLQQCSRVNFGGM